MTRRNWTIFAAMVVAALFLVGCGGDDGATGPQGMQGPAGPAGPAGEPGEDADPTTPFSSADAWEAIAGPMIEESLTMQINTLSGTMPGAGNVDHAELVAAITAVATMYSVDATDILAALEAANPSHATLRRVWVDLFIAAQHEAGELAATRDSVVVALTGPEGPTGDTAPDELLAMAWEEIAGAAIEADLAARIGTTGPLTHTMLTAAIKATAKKFGISATAALAALDAANPTFEAIQRSRVTAIVAMLHAGDYLAATVDSAEYVIAMQASVAVDTQPVGCRARLRARPWRPEKPSGTWSRLHCRTGT